MSEIKLEIGEGQIKNAIAIALSESFTQDKKDALIRDIIRGHLNVKTDSWSRETLLSKCVGDLIRKIAEKEMSKVIENMRPQIQVAIKKYLGKGFSDSLCKQIEEAVQRIVVQNICIDIKVLPKSDNDD